MTPITNPATAHPTAIPAIAPRERSELLNAWAGCAAFVGTGDGDDSPPVLIDVEVVELTVVWLGEEVVEVVEAGNDHHSFDSKT